MKAKATVTIDKPRKLCFNVWAMEQIAEKHGSSAAAVEKMKTEGPQAREGFKVIVEMISMLINAEILRHNAAVKHGLETGEIEPAFQIDEAEVKALWQYADFKRCKVAIMEAMNAGYTAAEETENQDEERDLVLEELEAEKNAQKPEVQ